MIIWAGENPKPIVSMSKIPLPELEHWPFPE